MSGYALESDLDRTNVSVRGLEGQIANLRDELEVTDDIADENADILENVGRWLSNIISNLYEDPFPPATEEEWDEAHEYNRFLDNPGNLYIRNYQSNSPRPAEAGYALGAADALMSIFGFYRDEADCRCSCCKERGK